MAERYQLYRLTYGADDCGRRVVVGKEEVSPAYWRIDQEAMSGQQVLCRVHADGKKENIQHMLEGEFPEFELRKGKQ